MADWLDNLHPSLRPLWDLENELRKAAQNAIFLKNDEAKLHLAEARRHYDTALKALMGEVPAKGTTPTPSRAAAAIADAASARVDNSCEPRERSAGSTFHRPGSRPPAASCSVAPGALPRRPEPRPCKGSGAFLCPVAAGTRRQDYLRFAFVLTLAFGFTLTFGLAFTFTLTFLPTAFFAGARSPLSP